ncbi:MAG TPA: DMT family transporter [Methylomirabilota bacterium]|nr:DMT family transporter [Methylomirabilota bacterium]
MPDPRLRTYLLLVMVVVVWGSYPTLVKIALRDMPPFTLAALRCLLASAILTVLFWREAGERHHAVTRADLPALVILGVSGITISTGIFYLAVALTTASNAVILTASTPVLVAVGGHLFFGERLRPLQWAGVACSAFGVLLTVSRGHLRLLESPPSLGDGIVLAGQVAWATYTLYGKRVLARLSPRMATTAAYLIGTAFLVPLAVLLAPAFPPAVLTSVPAWGVVVFQGTVGTLSHVWYYRGVQTVGPSVTAIFMNLQPLVGVLLATLILGEVVSLVQGLGAAAIVAGVWLTTRRPAPAGRLRSRG